MDFEKRAPVIGCCMRLHNFCIDQGLDEEHLAAMNGAKFMLPGDGAVSGRWRTTPRFKDGRPVDQLNWFSNAAVRSAARSGNTRERLRQGVASDGICRPPPLPKQGTRRWCGLL